MAVPTPITAVISVMIPAAVVAAIPIPAAMVAVAVMPADSSIPIAIAKTKRIRTGLRTLVAVAAIPRTLGYAIA